MGFWAIAAPIIASAAGSAISGAMNKPGKQGTDSYVPPWYNELGMLSLENNKLGSTYLRNQLNALAAGQLPGGMQKYLDAIQLYRMRELQKDLYGRPGAHGQLDDAMAIGAITGTGPKRAQALTRTAMMDYADRQQAVSDFINQNAYNYMSQANRFVPAALMQQLNPGQEQLNNWSTPGVAGPNIDTSGIDWSKVFPGQQTQPQQAGVTGGFQRGASGMTVNDWLSIINQSQVQPSQNSQYSQYFT